MPLQSVAARDLMLDRMWETAPGTVVEVGLLNGDPALVGVELDAAECPGYGRYEVTWAGFWEGSASGVKTTILFTLCTASDGWDDAGVFDAIFVDGVLFDAAPLVEPVVVAGAGDVFMQVSRRFDEGVG